MASENILECYQVEGQDVSNLRKELIDLYNLKYKEEGETVDFYKWAYMRWLEIAQLSVQCYRLEDNELVSKIINTAKIICNNNDPEFTDEEGRNFSDILLTLKEEVFVSDYDDEKYDQVEWAHSDLWWINAVREDWIFMKKEL